MSIISDCSQGCSVVELRKEFDVINASNSVDRKISNILPSESFPNLIQDLELNDRYITPLPPLASDCSMFQHSDYKEIKRFVVHFLHPYISQECRPENEPENRLPMMDLLFRFLEEKGISLDKKIVEKIAMECYVLQAASGVYRFLRDDVLGAITTEEELNEYIFDRLKNALRPALKKDFPLRTITEIQLHNLVWEALKQYGIKFEKCVLKCRDVEKKSRALHQPSPFDKKTILKMLEVCDKLFVADIPSVILKINARYLDV